MASSDSTAPPQPSWIRALARLWCLRPIAAPPRGSPGAPTVALAAAWLAAWVLIDRWQRQPDPQFSTDGIALLGWYALATVVLAALLRSRAERGLAFGDALLLSVGAVPLPLFLMSVAIFLLEPPWFWAAAAAVAVYVFAFLARGLTALGGRPRPMTAALGVVFIAGFIYASDAVNAIPDLWNPRGRSATSEEQLALEETALFEQAARIDAALDDVARDPSPKAQGFFLGFAGVGGEHEFAEEIGMAARVLGERFALGDRHLSLLNDERDLSGAPLASVSGLDYALSGLAARMDPDNDVLFLAISSHGSEDPAIAVSNSDMPLANLTPEELAAALHDSGIKWRVIIVSACYAGGFIEPLRDPYTIVIAAAAADRTSFGCSNDRDLTYFGEAFYRDALPGAASIRVAFESAKKAIAAREQSEHETPSDPQAYFGAEMEDKLRGLSR